MSFIGNMFDGSKGNGFQSGKADILTPSNQAQADQTYNQSQDALNQQNAFLRAISDQGGINNQASVFNQLQNVANGTGPNPAQAMLNQSTGQNVANQAALMAGQRGAGANVGLMARQAANQGANTQQQAVGQGATLQANQSMNALNQMGGIANQQVQTQANAANSYLNGTQSANNNVLNGIAGQNNANVGMQSNQNSNNAQIANTNAQSQNKLVGGIMNGASSALGAFAHGGQIPNTGSGPKSKVGQHLASFSKGIDPQMLANGGDVDFISNAGNVHAQPNAPEQESSGPNPAMLAMMLAQGGKVPVLLSPGEKYLKPEEAKEVAKGKKDVREAGKTVPGKPDGKKDSLKNDTVAASAEEGGFVIPNSIMQGKNPAKDAAAFVRAHMSRSAKLGKK